MSLISDLVATAKNDALKAALPALASFFTNIASNTSAVNIMLQGGKLLADLNAALPTIEKDLLTDISNVITTEANALPK